MFQRPAENLIPYLTVYEHLQIAGELRGSWRPQTKMENLPRRIVFVLCRIGVLRLPRQDAVVMGDRRIDTAGTVMTGRRPEQRLDPRGIVHRNALSRRA